MTVNYKALLARAAARPVSLSAESTGICLIADTQLTEATQLIQIRADDESHAGGMRHVTNSENPHREVRSLDPKIFVAKFSNSKYIASRPAPALAFDSTALADVPTVTVTTKHFDELCLDLIKLPLIRSALKPNSRLSNVQKQRSCYDENLECPTLFRSLCICDPKMKGSPILQRSTYFSIGPRGLRVGKCEFANLAYEQQSEGFLDLSARPDIDGRPMFILEYANGLVDWNTGLPIWIMATQIDITKTIHKLVKLSKMRDSDEGHCLTTANVDEPEDGAATSAVQDLDRDSAIHMDDGPEAYSVKSSLGIHPNKPFIFHGPSKDQDLDDIDASIDWVEANFPSSEDWTDRQQSHSPVHDSNGADSSENAETATAFGQLIKDVSFMHRSCFVLAPSADLASSKRSSTTSTEWQITHLSPFLYARPLDRRAALSHTPSETLQQMGFLLSRDRPVSCLVNWGQDGRVQRLYCSPMLRSDEVGCWLCFLVDPTVRDLWGLEAGPPTGIATDFPETSNPESATVSPLAPLAISPAGSKSESVTHDAMEEQKTSESVHEQRKCHLYKNYKTALDEELEQAHKEVISHKLPKTDKSCKLSSVAERVNEFEKMRRA